MRSRLLAALGAALLALGPLAARADCLTPDGVNEELAPIAVVVSVTGGDEGRALADALADHFNLGRQPVSAVAAYVGPTGRTAVYAFAPNLCAIQWGLMPLATFNNARAAAGLARIVLPDKGGQSI